MRCTSINNNLFGFVANFEQRYTSFNAIAAEGENIIRRMETELESLRQKQEADTKEEVDSVMEAEFDRLCNMPIDMHNTPDNRHLQGRVSSKKD